jgi:hypothetical protein
MSVMAMFHQLPRSLVFRLDPSPAEPRHNEEKEHWTEHCEQVAVPQAFLDGGVYGHKGQHAEKQGGAALADGLTTSIEGLREPGHNYNCTPMGLVVPALGTAVKLRNQAISLIDGF